MKEYGRAGREAKEDCWVEILPLSLGGIKVSVESTVESLYGERIRQIVAAALESLGFQNAVARVKDQGALDWVLAARVEAAARRLLPELEASCVPDFPEENRYYVEKDRLRRSRLYVPGNQPDLMVNAGLFQPDAVILDLEDSVAPTEKDTARLLVRNALCSVDFRGVEKMVRINQLPAGFEDLPAIVPYHVHTILIPKCERAAEVRLVAEQAAQIKDQHGLEEPTFLMPILETALGIVNAYEIATASSEVVAVAFGAEDFTRDIGAKRTEEGLESFVARSQVVLAAWAAGIQPIDTVYSNVENIEGLLKSTKEAIALGFDGKGCIHPRQVEVIHEAFRPEESEVLYARKVKAALEEARKKGLGVVAIESKMIDPPVVARALKVLKLAELYGVSPNDPGNR